MKKLLLITILLATSLCNSMKLEIINEDKTKVLNLIKDLEILVEPPSKETLELEKLKEKEYAEQLKEEKKALRENKKLNPAEEIIFPKELYYREFYHIAMVQEGNKTIFYEINKDKDVERLIKNLNNKRFSSIVWGKLENGKLYTIIPGRHKNKLICLDQTLQSAQIDSEASISN